MLINQKLKKKLPLSPYASSLPKFRVILEGWGLVALNQTMTKNVYLTSAWSPIGHIVLIAGLYLPSSSIWQLAPIPTKL